jgi:hypothetical protein
MAEVVWTNDGDSNQWVEVAGTGFLGQTGYTGSTGSPGGYTGSASTVAGYTGSFGNTGFVGSRGFTGSVGFTGSAGFVGSVGFVGSIGYSGSAGFVGSIGYSGSVSDGGSNSYAVGYKELPQSATTSGNLVLTDSAKHLYVSAGVTVPPNSTVAFAIGTVVTIINSSASTITITQGVGVTVRQTGTTNTGNRTLIGYGMCSAVKVATDTWYISGSGLT